MNGLQRLEAGSEALDARLAKARAKPPPAREIASSPHHLVQRAPGQKVPNRPAHQIVLLPRQDRLQLDDDLVSDLVIEGCEPVDVYPRLQRRHTELREQSPAGFLALSGIPEPRSGGFELLDGLGLGVHQRISVSGQPKEVQAEAFEHPRVLTADVGSHLDAPVLCLLRRRDLLYLRFGTREEKQASFP